MLHVAVFLHGNLIENYCVNLQIYLQSRSIFISSHFSSTHSTCVKNDMVSTIFKKEISKASLSPTSGTNRPAHGRHIPKKSRGTGRHIPKKSRGTGHPKGTTKCRDYKSKTSMTHSARKCQTATNRSAIYKSKTSMTHSVRKCQVTATNRAPIYKNKTSMSHSLGKCQIATNRAPVKKPKLETPEVDIMAMLEGLGDVDDVKEDKNLTSLISILNNIGRYLK
jgi:hypothetical protein